MTQLLLATVLAAAAPQGPAAAEAIEVDLSRTYAAGESQAYTVEMKITLPGMDDKVVISGGMTWKVLEQSATGAKVEASYRDVKVAFGSDEAPVPGDIKSATLAWDAFGIPTEYGSEAIADEDNPIAGFEILAILPKQKLGLGKEFKFNWNGAETKIEGSGKLIATGRLYEEHVAKVEMDIVETPKGDDVGTYRYTAYFNSKSGKLVKAEGTYESDSPEMGGKVSAEFVLKKVRN